MVEDSKEHPGWNNIPGFAKTIILTQTVVIFFLSFWIFQEFQNNVYLQSYVNGFLQSSGVTLVAVASVGFFSFVAVLLSAKLHRTRKELETVLTAGRQPQSRTTGFLDNRTEEHLIEMIRRTTPQPSPNSETGSSLPVLKREDQAQPSSNQPPTQ